MARRKKLEEHENHERWMVSYADFITLLFAFFVVMYSVSSVNEGKYRVLSDSLTAAFRAPPQSSELVSLGEREDGVGIAVPMQGIPSLIALPIPQQPEPQAEPDRDSDAPIAEAEQAEDAAKPMNKEGVDTHIQQIADEIVEAMGSLIDDDLINVRRDKRWLEVEIKSSILFPSGSSRLAPAAFSMMKPLAEILAKFPNPVHVEGFTDNIPIHTVQFLSNWELSAARAASVVHLFTDYGVAPDRMAAIGYGEYKPRGDNETPEGRAMNRRVVLVVMPGVDPRWTRDGDEAGALVTEGNARSKPVEAPPP